MAIRTVNIKGDLPTAEVALRRIHMALTLAQSQGDKALKIIHGYGSTGQGGTIRVQARRYLAQQKARGRIRAYIPGESFSIFNEETLRLFAQCPALRQDCDLNRENNGITLIVL
jgi:hypothetical protein